MTKEEILQRLNNGARISKNEHLIFKYGVLKRGSKISFSIDGITIKSTQFYAIEHLLEHERGTSNSQIYKIKNEPT